MTTININIKVKAGPRTPASVDVELTSVNPKTLKLANGKTVSDADLARWLKNKLMELMESMESKTEERQ